MMSLNKVELIGRLTADPVLREMPSGIQCATMRLATGTHRKDPSGMAHREAEYHAVVMFGKLATVAEKYLKKGDGIYVSGLLRNIEYTASNGKRRSTVRVIANNLIMLGGGKRQKPDTRNDDVVAEETPAEKNGED